MKLFKKYIKEKQPKTSWYKKGQMQIFRYPTNPVFYFSIIKNSEALTILFFVKYLSFSFNEKIILLIIVKRL